MEQKEASANNAGSCNQSVANTRADSSLSSSSKRMPKEEIMAYARKIRPLVRGTLDNAMLMPENQDKPLYWAKPARIRTESFTFRADAALMKAEGLQEIGRIITYHRYGGYRKYLRPSADEAIYQCPKEWLDKVCAFEIQIDSNRMEDIYDSRLDCHVLRTVYYTGTLPEEIANLPVEW